MTFLQEYEASNAKVDLLHQWVGTRAKELFAELREARPVLVTPGPVLVTRYADVQEVLSRHKVFTVRHLAERMDDVVGPYMLARDATTINERDRGIMQAVLRRDDLPRVRETVARLAELAIDEETEDGRMDVVSGLSRRVPVDLCGDYFGFPGPDRATMMRWSRTANLDFFFNLGNDPEPHRAAVACGEEMRAYLGELIAHRRAGIGAGERRDDVLGRLLESRFPEAIGFDDERIAANVMFMLLGGVETVSGAVILALDELLRRPDQLAAATRAARGGDSAEVGRHAWEALRLNPIFAFVARRCVADYTLASGTERETRIPAGTLVYASLASAGLDGHELPEPEQYRLGRPEHHLNMHFGYGHHLCLCYYLSGVEVPEILARLLRRGVLRAPGDEGQIDTRGGPFAERLIVELED
jgi:cytochrome P450